MSKRQKLLGQIRNNPKNVRLEHLLKLMTDYEFSYRKTADAYYFYHEKLKNEPNIPRVAIPHGGENKVKKFYVLSCLDAIETLESLE